ncbi:hypothetical protein LshimejAT787_1900340 [Lyophyllum shimeji]|uniref:Uncharacterized protein n=1 Tax=Lyophyllum shimeji TaxID=47721 RepID=A0A9P3Q1G5_LYOSH|nr:hypothetical protein LshimejAT787_1900340 [Lyophyllum shimeji]
MFHPEGTPHVPNLPFEHNTDWLDRLGVAFQTSNRVSTMSPVCKHRSQALRSPPISPRSHEASSSSTRTGMFQEACRLRLDQTF